MKTINFKNQILLLTMLWLFVLPIFNSQAETKTDKTFWPIPRGVYDSIQLYPQATLPLPCKEGTLQLLAGVASDIYLCIDDVWTNFSGASIWTNNNGYVHPADESNPELKKVGIGTSTPLFQLTLENDGGIIAQSDIQGHSRNYYIPIDVSSTAFKSESSGTLLAGEFSSTVSFPIDAISFGKNNLFGIPDSSILGGEENKMTNNNSLELVTPERELRDAGSVIAGGYKNNINYQPDPYINPPGSLDSFIGGGINNTINGMASSVIGGGNSNFFALEFNNSSINTAVIGGGGGTGQVLINNDHFYTDSPTGTYSTFLRNNTGSPKSVIGGGSSNLISGSVLKFATILGGFNNTIQNFQFNGMIENADIWGQNNFGSQAAFILGGRNNRGIGHYFVIGGGFNNYALSMTGMESIAGGEKNRGFAGGSAMGGLLNDSSGGGSGNIYSVGGSGNTGEGGGSNNNFWSGQNNTGNRTAGAVSFNSTKGFIAGGYANNVTGQYSAVLNGRNNSVTGNSSVAGGKYVTLSGNNTFVWGHGTAAAPINITQSNSFIVATGSVGINNDSPEDKFDVKNTDNDINTMHIDQGTLILANVMANPKSTVKLSGTTILGKDIAENFDLTEPIEPGDVLSLSESSNSISLSKSRSPYDSKAIGIASNTAAAVFDNSQVIFSTNGNQNNNGSLPVALTGQVMCKVNLENGPIAIGDPLTTSSMAGYAMKATDKSKAFGTIIAKAMESFNETTSGKQTGLIKVLVIKK